MKYRNNFYLIYDFSFKYRLLYCLMLNYYRKYYADNKFNGEMIVVSSNKNKLTFYYDKIYSTINEFTANDIQNLKKFTNSHDEQLCLLFNYIENKQISYNKIIQDLKLEYIENKGIFKYYDLNSSKFKLTDDNDNNIIFMEMANFEKYEDNQAVREIFIPEYFSVKNDKIKQFMEEIYLYIKNINICKDILKDNNAKEPEFLSLNVFIESDNGLEIEDEIINLIYEKGIEKFIS